MDLTKLSETELKALAYDELVRMETIKSNILIINQELGKRSGLTTNEEKEAKETKEESK